MKKLFPKLVPALGGVALGMVLSLVLFVVTRGMLYRDTLGITFDGGVSPSSATDAELVDMAYHILEHIKDGDYEGLAKTVHPDYGVVFSPYANITLSSNKCFTAEQISGFSDDKNVYVWGVYDGSGNPIEMTPADYFSRFVFDKDFTKSSQIGVNYIVRSGNALENFKEVFPDARFVDFHVPSNDKETEDIGWKSLRLGFEESGGELRLTVILHSEWTI